MSVTKLRETEKVLILKEIQFRKILVRRRMMSFSLSSKKINLTMKSPACIVPISTDWPISSSSCFTMYSFARPISFFVAPFATEQISISNPEFQESSFTLKVKSGSTKMTKDLSLYPSQFEACLLVDKQYIGKQLI